VVSGQEKKEKNLVDVSISVRVDGSGKPRVTTYVDAPERADVRVDTGPAGEEDDQSDQSLEQPALVTVEVSLDLEETDQGDGGPQLRPVDDAEEQ
jgi:hypothetical protein